MQGNSMDKQNPEVKPRRKRKRFTVAYKLEILKKIDNCEQGEVASILRKEGLYSSYIERWRKQYNQGVLTALKDDKRGRKPKEINPLQKKVDKLEKEKLQLEKKLRQAEKIIEFQKKIAELLESEE